MPQGRNEANRASARAHGCVRAARLAGAGYVVLTTKHHEGFALWDTALSDFSAPRACGRDLVREFVDAVRAEGLRVGLYHSLIDWHHPDFTVDWVHPRRDDEAAHAMRALYNDTHNVAEGAGAAAFAAALQQRDRLRGQCVGVSLTGANVDAAVLARVLQQA